MPDPAGTHIKWMEVGERKVKAKFVLFLCFVPAPSSFPSSLKNGKMFSFCIISLLPPPAALPLALIMPNETWFCSEFAGWQELWLHRSYLSVPLFLLRATLPPGHLYPHDSGRTHGDHVEN